MKKINSFILLHALASVAISHVEDKDLASAHKLKVVMDTLRGNPKSLRRLTKALNQALEG